MDDKDHIPFQARRLEDAAKALNPSCIVKFDPNARHKHLRFSIWSGSVLLTNAFPEIAVSKIAEMSDEQLKQMIQQLSSGLL